MSLIADALKAAQRDRGQADAGARSSRRLIAASVLGREGGARGAFAGSPLRLPRSLGLAGALFGIAVVAAVGVVAISPERAPRAQPASGEEMPTLPLPAAVAANGRQSEPAAGDSAAAVAAAPAPESAPAPARSPAPPAPRVDAAAVEAAPPPARAVAPQSGRFQITVEPTLATVDAVLADAVAAHRRGELTSAITLYERAVAASPGNGQAWKNLGTAYQATGQAAPARDAFRHAIEVDARDAAAWSGLGAVLGTLGQVEEAQAALGEAIRLDPSNGGAKVNLANHYLARGLGADARRLLEEVVRDAPTHPEAHYALGRLLETQGDRAGAIGHYRTFLESGRGRFPQQETLVRRRIEQLGGG